MTRPTWTSVCSAAMVIGAASAIAVAQGAPKRAAQPPTAVDRNTHQEREAANVVVKRYCVGCHNDTRKTGGLTLSAFDVWRAADNAEVAEKMIRKLQSG